MGNANRPAFTVPTMQGPQAVRCSYVYLDKPYANKPTDNATYQLVLMFRKDDPADMAAVQKLAADLEAIRIEQWPNPQTRPMIPIVAMQPGQGPKSPIKDGDVAVNSSGRPIKEKDPEYSGHYIVSCSNSKPVRVFGSNMETINPALCYSGYWYKVSINAYAYSNNGGGVTVGLNGVQFIREDVILGGGGPSAEEMFTASGGQDPNMYQQPQQAPAFNQGNQQPFNQGNQQPFNQGQPQQQQPFNHNTQQQQQYQQAPAFDQNQPIQQQPFNQGQPQQQQYQQQPLHNGSII